MICSVVSLLKSKTPIEHFINIFNMEIYQEKN